MLKFVVLGGVLLLCVAIGVALFMFSSWKSDIVASLEADPDRRVAVTALGDVEYAILGDGVPLLTLHGGMGGYDQSLATLRAVPELAIPNSMTIAVSRPGYLGTPLSSGETYQQQADLFAALLDELEIDRAIVFASSSSGYVGLQFALRHPERTIGLVLYAPGVSTQTGLDVEDVREMNGPTMFLAEFSIWLLGNSLAPRMMEGFDREDPIQVATLEALVETIVPMSARAAGERNDALQRLDPAIDDWPLEEISAPTLIVHGNADANTPYEASARAASQIPNAELVTIEGGDHYVILTRQREVSEHIDSFVRSLAASASLGR